MEKTDGAAVQKTVSVVSNPKGFFRIMLKMPLRSGIVKTQVYDSVYTETSERPVADGRKRRKHMEIIWHGHSCFTVRTEAGSVVFDPYEDGKIPGLRPLRLKADAVLCSHEHGDHNFREGVALSEEAFTGEIEEIPSWHDDVQGAKRGPNTIQVIHAEGMKLVHLGDLGTELDAEQIETLRIPDVLLIPIGGFYTIDTKQALKIVDELSPRITVPMHFRRGDVGFDVLSTAEEFLKKCPNPVVYPGNTLTVDPETPAQTAVLQLRKN